MIKAINLDEHDENVKQFFESLLPDPEGAMVELNDRRVFILVRPAHPTTLTHALWTNAKNQRRSDLVDKEIDGTLTPSEVVELAELQKEMIDYVNRVAPLPLEEARKLHQQLLEKARLSQFSSDGTA